MFVNNCQEISVFYTYSLISKFLKHILFAQIPTFVTVPGFSVSVLFVLPLAHCGPFWAWYLARREWRSLKHLLCKVLFKGLDKDSDIENP